MRSRREKRPAGEAGNDAVDPRAPERWIIAGFTCLFTPSKNIAQHRMCGVAEVWPNALMCKFRQMTNRPQ